ncbi:hypothetical protein ACS0TY_024541 [Phlomoides rotata]
MAEGDGVTAHHGTVRVSNEEVAADQVRSRIRMWTVVVNMRELVGVKDWWLKGKKPKLRNQNEHNHRPRRSPTSTRDWARKHVKERKQRGRPTTSITGRGVEVTQPREYMHNRLGKNATKIMHGRSQGQSHARSEGLTRPEQTSSQAGEQPHGSAVATAELARMQQAIEKLQAQLAAQNKATELTAVPISPLSPTILQVPIQKKI